jgi:hypothetical protein
MTMPTKLSTPRVKVTLASDPDKVLEVQTTNADLVLWDRTRLKHRWPKFEDAPFLWLTFISWAGARRSALIPPELTYEAWELDVLEADASDDDPNDETGAPFPERQ